LNSTDLPSQKETLGGEKILRWFFVALFSLFAIYAFLNEKYYEMLIDIVLVLANLVVTPLLQHYAIKTAVKKNMESPLLYGNINRFYFYQDCYVNVDNQSTATVFYNQLINAYETDRYFYLYIHQNQAHIIPKISFTYNTPYEMRKLLSIKLGPRFIIRCK
jgi:hypothetical protein